MTIDLLSDDFTRADLAHLVNALVVTGYLFASLVVMLLGVIVFRGK